MWSSSSTRQPRHARPSRRGRTILILSSFLLIGFSGFVIGLYSIFSPIKCYQGKPRSVKVFLGGEGSDGGGGELLALEGGGEIRRRHKVMAFVGIQTGFGSVGRRRSLRKTWMPSDREGLRRLEETTGLAFRFVIGRTKDSAKMSELRKEVADYDDFLLLDIQEEYSKLPYKTLAFFKAAFALFDSKFYVKADDDIYLRPDRLSLLLTKERGHSQIYLGCMKKGPVFTNPRLKWLVTLSDKDEAKLTEYDGQKCRLSKPLTPKGDKFINDRYEPLGDILGKEYFFHAYGPIYALSAEVVASLVALRNNSFRMFSNEDVTIGAWMLALDVRHENHKALCEAECTPNSIAVWDIPKCSGLCNPEKRLLELHQMESCSGNSSSVSDG